MLELKGVTVVVPVDFSEACTTALTGPLTESSADDIRLVHVVQPTVYPAAGDVVVAAGPDAERVAAAGEQFERYIKEQNWPSYPTEVLTGDPGTEVVAFADRIEADLIMVPSHGFHGWKRLVLGSVAERIVRLANCPVLVLRRGDAE